MLSIYFYFAGDPLRYIFWCKHEVLKQQQQPKKKELPVSSHLFFFFFHRGLKTLSFGRFAENTNAHNSCWRRGQAGLSCLKTIYTPSLNSAVPVPTQTALVPWAAVKKKNAQRRSLTTLKDNINFYFFGNVRSTVHICCCFILKLDEKPTRRAASLFCLFSPCFQHYPSSTALEHNNYSSWSIVKA